MDYFSQDLGQMWSGERIRNAYGQGVHFTESDLPFKIVDIAANPTSILEIGSAFGQCYRFLLSQGIDPGAHYTGTDISDEGQELCRELYPESTWVKGNFLDVELGGTFDYVIERNAIHHMPSPLRCVEKAVGLADRAVKMHMRVRTRHETLSDVSKGYFISRSIEGEEKGRYFYNLVNLYELVDTILAMDNIREIRLGLSLHDTAATLPDAAIPPDVLEREEELYYCRCLVIKGDTPQTRISISPVHLKPFVLEALKRPKSVTRYLSTRGKILKKARTAR